MRSVVIPLTGLTSSATSIAALTTLGAAGTIPMGGALATNNGVANAQTLGAAGNLVLNGVNVLNGTAYFSFPTKLNLSSAGNLSGVSFTIVGLTAQGPDTTLDLGGPNTEVVVGPNNGIVTSGNTWLRIYSITASAAVGTNVTAYGTATSSNATQVTLTSVNNLSGVNFIIYGMDASGTPRTETLAGPNNNTVASLNYWLAVDQIATNGAVTAVSVGNSASSATAWIPVDRNQASFNVGLQCVVSGGAINYTVQTTGDSPYSTTVTSDTPFTSPVPSLSGASSSQYTNVTFPVRAIRTITNSGTGVVTTTVFQGLKT